MIDSLTPGATNLPILALATHVYMTNKDSLT